MEDERGRGARCIGRKTRYELLDMAIRWYISRVWQVRVRVALRGYIVLWIPNFAILGNFSFIYFLKISLAMLVQRGKESVRRWILPCKLNNRKLAFGYARYTDLDDSF